MDWDALRDREFPVTRNWAYFDHAAVSPLPRRSGQQMRAWVDEQEGHGVVHWLDWEARLEAIRRDLANLIGAEADEIAFVNSTTQGLGLIAEGFGWQAGDNVVTAEEEYPSNLYPWMNLADRGVTLKTVPTREGRLWVEDFERAIDARTRLLTISYVEWASGFRNDLDALGALCRDRGVALCVDAIQGLGALPLDVARTPIDFLAADGHKWLLGPEGAGLLYVRRSWIERLRPILVGWHSVQVGFNQPGIHFDLKPSAQRWEGGSFNMPGLLTFGASVGLLLELGLEAVSGRILDRADRVRELAAAAGWRVLSSERAGDRSGIVAIGCQGVEPDAAARHLKSLGVAVSSRRGRIRISPHVYNNQDDLDRLHEGLAGLARQAPGASSPRSQS